MNGQGRVRRPEGGSVSIWLVTTGFAMIVLVGLAVDLGGQVHAQQQARAVAGQAARAGGQQLQPGPAVRGDAARADTTEAAAAARAFLTSANIAPWLCIDQCIVSSGSGRVLQVCGVCRCSMTFSCRKCFAAVVRDMPAFIALMLIVFPWLRSLTSLVSWALETTTSEQHCPSNRCQTARRPTPESRPPS